MRNAFLATLLLLCTASLAQGQVTDEIFCAVLAPGNIEAQERETSLLDIPVANFEVKNSDVNSTLQKLAYTYKVPIGVEAVYIGDGETRPVIDIKVESGTVRDVVNSFVNLYPKYEYAEIDGVIDF